MIDLKKREELEKAATVGDWNAFDGTVWFVDPDSPVSAKGIANSHWLSQPIICSSEDEELESPGFDGAVIFSTEYDLEPSVCDLNLIAHYRNDAAEVNAWIREAVRLMEQEANEYEQFAAPESSPRAKTLRAHIAKVKLEER